MIYYFDTNVLIYLITEKGEFSKKVWEFLNSLKKEDLVVIPTITILEAVHVLQ
jgi:predicted nucleic acid-binding protein